MSTSYNRPDIYELECSGYTSDIPFFRDIAQAVTKDKSNNILELACGTGRVTIPLAMHGFNITGIDSSYPMIRTAKHKCKGLDISGKLHFAVGDMRDYITRKGIYEFVFIAFNSFQQLLTLHDQIVALENIKHMLKPKGYFLAEIAVPAMFKVAMTSETSKILSEEKLLLTRKMVSEVNRVTQVVTRKFYYQLFELEGQRRLIEKLWVPRNYCNIYPLQWENMLVTSGFRIEQKYGDFDGSTFNKTSRKMLFLCQKI